MVYYRLSTGVKVLFAFFLTSVFLFVFTLVGRFPLAKGVNEEYYLYSDSSQATIHTDVLGWDCLFVAGVSGEYYVGEWDAFWNDFREDYRAIVLAEEEVGAVVSYYLYSPLVYGGQWIEGNFVNVQVSRNENIVKVGTPMIFGGY